MDLQTDQIIGLEGSAVSDGDLSLDPSSKTFGIQRGGLINLSDIDESPSLQNPEYILANRGSGSLHEITQEDIDSGSDVYGIYSLSMVPEKESISLVWSGSDSNPNFTVTEPGTYHLLVGNMYMYIFISDINTPSAKTLRNWSYIFSSDELLYTYRVRYDPSSGFHSTMVYRTYVGGSAIYSVRESSSTNITEIWKGL